MKELGDIEATRERRRDILGAREGTSGGEAGESIDTSMDPVRRKYILDWVWDCRTSERTG